jgi:hypothetical protein
VPERSIGIDRVPEINSLWLVSMDGQEINRLWTKYDGNVREDGLSEEEWGKVVTTAAQTLAHCPDPNGHERRITGLALGKVQSGKTLSYTALIALATDNGYRITIVLAGTKETLLEQTRVRLIQDLDVLERRRITLFVNPTLQDAPVVEAVTHHGGHALVIVLKHQVHIDNLGDILSSAELRSQPTLIVDDEGDEASLNTQHRRGQRSTIYNSIVRLRDRLRLHAYIAYTATPQANLLLQELDVLSPDFITLVHPGSTYCGGSVFFGEGSDRYIRVIPDGDASPDNAAIVTGGLSRALSIFYAAAGIATTRGDRDDRVSILLHTSQRKADHQNLRNAVEALRSRWRQQLALPDSDPSAVACRDLFRAAYDDICSTMQSPPPWETVREGLSDEIAQTETWMVNSLPAGRDPIAMQYRIKNNILIGGKMLQRGVTIPRLAITYITIQAAGTTNADTLEQRARWFGYKRQYLDICRIFLSARLRGRYTELLRFEDDFWNVLDRNQRQGLSIRDWARMFRLDIAGWELRPTRTSVASFRAFGGGGWDVQRKYIENRETNARNIGIAREFFQRHPGTLRRYANTEHRIVEDCELPIVISELLARMSTDGTNWENAYVKEYLSRLYFGGRLHGIDVLLMSDGMMRRRQQSDGRLDNPMQGRTDGADPDRDYYPGDEYIHNERVQLQVHLVEPTDAQRQPIGIETTILALYIPPDPQYDLRLIVRGEES